jgi:multiple sugar transport system substrate-binding protein
MFLKSKSTLMVVLALVLMLSMGISITAQEDIGGSLDIMGFTATDEIATTRVDLFNELYPDVELNFSEGGLDKQQFLTAVASGNAPDLVYMGRDTLSSYASRGALVPLTECIADMEIDMSQYRPASVEQVTVGGEIYGIPEFFNVIVLIVNNAALADAGLTMDDLDTSDWEGLSAANDALTLFEDDELVRIGFDPKLPEFLPLWAMANGVSLISADGRTAQLDDPAVIEALEYTVGLHEVAGGRQPFMAFRDTWDFFGSGNQMAADQLGAFPMEQWYANVLVGASPDADISFAAFLDREGNPLSYATGNTWAIPRGSENVEAACAFMKTVTSLDAWTAAAQVRADQRAEEGRTNTGVYTSNVWADEVIFNEIMQPSGNEAFDNGVQAILSIQDNAFSIPGNPAAAEFKQAWQDAINRVLNGEQTAEEALTQAQAEAQAALDEAWDQ